MKIETKSRAHVFIVGHFGDPFCLFIGIINPFSNNNTLNLFTTLPAGIEVGSQSV